jgi:hypothetical protein
MASIRIPWDSNVGVNLSNMNKSQNRILDLNIPIYSNLVEQVARNMPDAQNEFNKVRGKIDLAINDLKSIPNTLDGIISQFDVAGVKNQIDTLDSQINEEKLKQSKSDEILSLRKEQSETLIKKYGSNLHSSWLGLWRPLKENTHVGLNVASVVFGLIAVIFIGYFGYNYFTAAPANGGATNAVRNGSNRLVANLIGGFQKVKHLYN